MLTKTTTQCALHIDIAFWCRTGDIYVFLEILGVHTDAQLLTPISGLLHADAQSFMPMHN